MKTTGHGPASWAQMLALDAEQAKRSATLSALSMLVPSLSASGPWPGLYRSLIAAARRGVRVEILLAAPSKSHPATAQNATMARRAHDSGLIVGLVPGPALLHAKTALFDNSIAWAGSGNFTAAAARHNWEFWFRSTDGDSVDALASFHNTLRGL